MGRFERPSFFLGKRAYVNIKKLFSKIIYHKRLNVKNALSCVHGIKLSAYAHAFQ